MIKLRVQKYIFREIVIPMGLGVFTLCFILLMGNLLKLTELVINKGVPFKEIALLFVYIFPSFMDITLAMAFLLGLLVGFGRLSGDSEIIAMKASGVSIGTMFKPVLVLAFIITLGIGWVLFYAKPVSRVSFKEQVFSIVNNRLTTGLQPMVFQHDFEGVVIYAENIDAHSGRLENIFLHDHRDPSTTASIFASHGNIFSNPQNLAFSISLKNGTILNQPLRGKGSSFQTLSFDTYDINLSFEDKGAASRRSKLKPKTLTMAKINKSLANKPTETNRHLLKIEWHKRLALCFAPFLFALVGVPLGIHSPRSGKIGGFAVALLIFLTYFVLSSLAESICKDGNLKVYGLIWLPNALFLLAGSYLIFCASREKDIFYFLPTINLSSILRGFGKGEK
jgi:lipopolysaccharide export system permease protein